MSHTPGKWRVVNRVDVQAEAQGCLAYISTAGARGRTLEEAEANANLIAAAPDLLAALEEVVAISDRKHNAWDKAHAAIAKAKGIQP